MKIFDACISSMAQDFLRTIFTSETTLTEVNSLLRSISGINGFFESDLDLAEMKEKLIFPDNIPEDPDRAQYGDFQTNPELALAISQYLANRVNKPQVLIEPTCGKGNFILAALSSFNSLEKVFGIEIYKPYVWEAKFSILDFFLKNPNSNKPEIALCNYNVFDFDFDAIALQAQEKNILIIGNPPWVTNAMLGSLNSSNLPTKSNFKKHSGMDAMTGKGNFDIAEYIILMMFQAFQNLNGNLALLVKNSVIKNIVLDQRKNNYRVGSFERHCIDSKKEFNVSVDASMLLCQLNSAPTYNCKEFSFYDNSVSSLNFGWVDDKFVSNVERYVHSRVIDGRCVFEWRQGLKHDCSNVMELDKVKHRYVNSLKEEVELEDGLVYGILKSSDLKNTIVRTARKYTIVTQRKVGQDTSYIKQDFPKTFNYLSSHQSSFDSRKSSIYKGKPAFSIFGIGEYSFKPYKVVISGLYKTFHFTLVLPDHGKPLMLDDTCYMLSFDDLDHAVYTLILLNSQAAKELLQSITFADAKRTFTKDILMRFDLFELSNKFTLHKLQTEIEVLNTKYNLNASLNAWDSYLRKINPNQGEQIKMFA